MDARVRPAHDALFHTGQTGVGSGIGASVNYVFIEHFQEIARGHFTVRRLERVYGKDVVRAEYDRLAGATDPRAT
jgi:hypothetical protein